ncbi:ABC transporter ATP-binding protein [Candidatus Dependentiae bacterium]|nr:ABC transporter ATP-binding protein [Candidatus Dependentiae bacterium]
MLALLEVKNLVKKFGTFSAVNNISFSVKQGEIVGLLGANGAGKTTTIQMLLTAITPTSGSINYFGLELATHRSEILQQVAFASTYVKMPGNITVYNNLDIYGRLYGLSGKQRKQVIEKYLYTFGMWHMRDSPVALLSAGQTTRAMLAKAFLANPRIILLDEPTASLDLDVALEVRAFILEQRRKNDCTVLITSHNMDEVAAVCDRVLVMQHGALIANDTPARLAATLNQARIELVIEHNQEAACTYARKHALEYRLKANTFVVRIDEYKIAAFLKHFAAADIEYSSITIDKPSLEDYFLHMTHNQKKNITLL